MELVGPRPGNQVNLYWISTMLRAEIGSFHTKFCDRVNVGNCGSIFVESSVGIQSVDQEFVLIVSAPIALNDIVQVSTGSSCYETHAGNQTHQLDRISPV